MALTTRRFLFPAALVLFIMLVSAGRLSTPVDVKAAFDPNGPAWDPLSTFDTSDTPRPVFQPPRLLAGTNSHALPADAARRNGYCLDANIEGVTPYAGAVPVGSVPLAVPTAALGFLIYATGPINPASSTPSQVLISPLAVSMAGAATSSTADDVYCVVASAPVGYKFLHIEWHYEVGGVKQPALILSSVPTPTPAALPIVTVTLEKIGNGIFGSPAEVCTVGWDAAFLTGRASNAGGLAGVTPDPLDDVVIADFTTSGGTASVFVDYVRKVGPEWCAGVGSTSVENNVQVTFNFDAVYNRVDIPRTPPPPRDQDEDDQSATATLPATRLVYIRDDVPPELRHVTQDGYVPPRRLSGFLVINSQHTICAIGSSAGDILVVQFDTLSGSPSSPPPQIFTKTAATHPELVGVPENTICFSYTSGSPGEHAVRATLNGEPIGFDSDRDGNGVAGSGPPVVTESGAGPLVTQWSGIGSTIITLGGPPEPANDVNGKTIELPLAFNVSDGTFIAGASIREWVLGTSVAGGSPPLLTGASLRVRLVGTCGYFVVPDSSRPTELRGVSVVGEFELNAGDIDPSSPAFGDTDASPDQIVFSTLNSPGCNPASTVTIEIDVFYPGQSAAALTPSERVSFRFTNFQPALKTPRLAWAGQTVTITYAISSGTSCADQNVIFLRGARQPGSFVPGPGIQVLAPDHAIVNFGDSCSASVRYESEDSGEVDIEAFVEGNDFSKIAFPIFYLVLEDVVIEATPDQFVSTFGDVTARLRGYFVGTNPSGRPQETKPDGRVVPADRWVLPDDWEQLKGPSDFRGNWGSPTMPPTVVTFFMENESVRNNYKTKVKHGAAGFFIPDDIRDFDFPFNINPHTKVPSVLGTVDMPRIMSQTSTDNGEASVDTFGDKNLSYEQCVANSFNGNPDCKLEDIVGRTRYFAVVEYPEAGHRGKWPAIASNVAETVWRWAGYKEVTIVNTDSPQIKYIVAHLRDRDGFCDAANFNNTLGVPVRFEIDAGGGAILEAADRPFTINGGRRFSTATTFDTTDALGRPINIEIVRPPLFADDPDECQAWIKVTNSLMVPTNVLVTFPAPPSPVPGDIRITNLVCTGTESITVKNFGTNLVNLGGFGLESIGTDIGNVEQLDLIGILNPGESKTFAGGPGASTIVGWIGSESEVFNGANDVAFLVWENFILSEARCSGSINHFTPPPSFPLDGEGEIIRDITIPFGNEVEVPLVAGWNLVPTGSGKVKIETALAELESKVTAIYVWNPLLEKWARYIPGAPDGVNTIDTIGGGQFMWVLVKEPFTLTLPK